MKWDATERTFSSSISHKHETDGVRNIANRGSFNFGGADSVVNWATSRGKLMRGHTLGKFESIPASKD
jgi:GH35 family endo-1,4-beta-xylanase